MKRRLNLAIIIGMVIIGLALWTASLSIRFILSASKAKATVVDMVRTKDGLISPVLEFTSRDGKTIRLETEASKDPKYKKGQSIDILYKHDDPNNWRANSFSDLWASAVVFGAIGLILSVAGKGFEMLLSGSKGEKVLLLLGISVFGVIGLLMIWGAWYFTSDTRKFMKDAMPASGRILELKRDSYEDTRGRKVTSYNPVIEFRAEDGRQATFTSEIEISPSAKNKYPVGKEIRILYNRLNPYEARIDSFDSLWGSSVILLVMGIGFVCASSFIYFIIYRKVEVDNPLFVGAGFLFGSILLFAAAWWMGRDSIYLLKHGEPVFGIVTEFNTVPIVEFETKDGKKIRHRTHVSSNHPEYSMGEHVPILYDPSDPYRAVVDSFSDLWFRSSLAGGLGVVFFAGSVYAFFAGFRKRR